jgi:hypothetical protein
MSDEVEWAEQFDEMGLWERQTGPLTNGWLQRVLRDLPEDDLPIEIAWYDGSRIRALVPMHLDVRADSGRRAALVLTVASDAQ